MNKKTKRVGLIYFLAGVTRANGELRTKGKQRPHHRGAVSKA